MKTDAIAATAAINDSITAIHTVVVTLFTALGTSAKPASNPTTLSDMSETSDATPDTALDKPLNPVLTSSLMVPTSVLMVADECFYCNNSIACSCDLN